MLGDISGVEHIYLACGYTDLRLGIDGLAQLVQQQLSLAVTGMNLILQLLYRNLILTSGQTLDLQFFLSLQMQQKPRIPRISVLATL